MELNRQLDKKGSRDRILKYLQDESFAMVLAPDEEHILARWDMADDLMRQYNSEKNVIAMLMKKFGISRSTAINDIMNAKLVWAYTSRTDKDYERRNIKEITSEIIAACIRDKDYETALKALKIRITALGLHRDDPDMPDWAKIEQHVYNIVYDPELVGAKKIENIEAVVEKYLQEKRKKAVESLPEAEMEE